MKTQDDDKRVVLTASIAGLVPVNVTIYSATKYATFGLGESLPQKSRTHGWASA